MNNKTKKRIVISITLVALFINFLFSIAVVWLPDLVLGFEYILWAAAQMWIIIFVLANIDDHIRK